MGWPHDKKDQYVAEFEQLARDNGIEARGGAHNGVYDAYRHAYVSGRFTQEYGSVVAKLVGDAHEMTHPNSKEEHAMDYHNNAVGRDIGGKTKGPNDLFQSLMQNENRMITDIKDVPSNKYGALNNPNAADAHFAGNVDTQKVAAFENLVAQGMTITQSTNGNGFIVSGAGEHANRQLVQNLEQFADQGKARELAQAVAPQGQTPERDQPARTMSA
jgi:hypothetical protein